METDHQALTTLKKVVMQKDPNSHFMRWAMALQEYNYQIVYKKGTANGNTDGLTRCLHINDPPGHWKEKEKVPQ